MSRPPKKTPDSLPLERFASVRCVVFDAVGTLIYPRPPVAAAYYELGRRHRSRLTRSDIEWNFRHALRRHTYAARTNEQLERERWRHIVADVFTDLDDTDSLFGQLWNHFARSSSWAVYDDVSGVATELNSLGLLTAIASNFDDRLLSISRELAALDQMQDIFVSSRLGFTKPSIKFFRAIEAKLRLQPNQLLMIGDDVTSDIQGAAQAGWHRLHLNRGDTTKVKETIQSLRDLSSLLA